MLLSDPFSLKFLIYTETAIMYFLACRLLLNFVKVAVGYGGSDWLKWL